MSDEWLSKETMANGYQRRLIDHSSTNSRSRLKAIHWRSKDIVMCSHNCRWWSVLPSRYNRRYMSNMTKTAGVPMDKILLKPPKRRYGNANHPCQHISIQINVWLGYKVWIFRRYVSDICILPIYRDGRYFDYFFSLSMRRKPKAVNIPLLKDSRVNFLSKSITFNVELATSCRDA